MIPTEVAAIRGNRALVQRLFFCVAGDGAYVGTDEGGESGGDGLNIEEWFLGAPFADDFTIVVLEDNL